MVFCFRFEFSLQNSFWNCAFPNWRIFQFIINRFLFKKKKNKIVLCRKQMKGRNVRDNIVVAKDEYHQNKCNSLNFTWLSSSYPFLYRFQTNSKIDTFFVVFFCLLTSIVIFQINANSHDVSVQSTTQLKCIVCFCSAFFTISKWIFVVCGKCVSIEINFQSNFMNGSVGFHHMENFIIRRNHAAGFFFVILRTHFSCVEFHPDRM